MDVKSRTKAEQSEATRAALLSAAAALFAERGYADTPTEEVVLRAGVTRGALYHHFQDKRDLFRAVFEEVEAAFVQRVAAASAADTGDVMARLRAGIDAFLAACTEPAIQRIVLLDGPSVLGWATYRALDAKYGLGLVKGALHGAMEAGVIERQPLDPLAHLFMSALHEAGMLIATAEDPATARKEVGGTIDRILAGLRPAR